MMVAIQSGALGPSVPQPVVMVVALVRVLAPVPRQVLEGKAARSWDLLQRKKSATTDHARVYLLQKKRDNATRSIIACIKGAVSRGFCLRF